MKKMEKVFRPFAWHFLQATSAEVNLALKYSFCDSICLPVFRRHRRHRRHRHRRRRRRHRRRRHRRRRRRKKSPPST